MSGVGIDGGSDTVQIVSTSEPAITVGLDMSDYTFAETATDAEVYIVATLDAAYPRAPSRNFGGIALSTQSDTAISDEDYVAVGDVVNFSTDDFQQVDGQYVASRLLSDFAILDDAIYEGSEQLLLELETASNTNLSMVQYANPNGTTELLSNLVYGGLVMRPLYCPR